MSVDNRACRWGCFAYTIEHRANEKSGEIGLLVKVQLVFDIWGIGIIGPRILLRARHDLDVHKLVGGKGLGVIKRGVGSLNVGVNRKDRGFRLRETRSLRNESGLLSITQNLTRVEIYDQRHLNGGIPHRTKYVHSTTPIV